MEGRLKSMDKRYDAKVDKAIMALRLQRYASRVPAGQRVPDLDAWLGIGASDKAIPGLDATLDALYPGSNLPTQPPASTCAIGTASCRERVCTSVSLQMVSDSLQKTTT